MGLARQEIRNELNQPEITASPSGVNDRALSFWRRSVIAG
jgi:hypothetical protein